MSRARRPRNAHPSMLRHVLDVRSWARDPSTIIEKVALVTWAIGLLRFSCFFSFFSSTIFFGRVWKLLGSDYKTWDGWEKDLLGRLHIDLGFWDLLPSACFLPIDPVPQRDVSGACFFSFVRRNLREEVRLCYCTNHCCTRLVGAACCSSGLGSGLRRKIYPFTTALLYNT
jgi:hypothetical protein